MRKNKGKSPTLKFLTMTKWLYYYSKLFNIRLFVFGISTVKYSSVCVVDDNQNPWILQEKYCCVEEKKKFNVINLHITKIKVPLF